MNQDLIDAFFDFGKSFLVYPNHEKHTLCDLDISNNSFENASFQTWNSIAAFIKTCFQNTHLPLKYLEHVISTTNDPSIKLRACWLRHRLSVIFDPSKLDTKLYQVMLKNPLNSSQISNASKLIINDLVLQSEFVDHCLVYFPIILEELFFVLQYAPKVEDFYAYANLFSRMRGGSHHALYTLSKFYHQSKHLSLEWRSLKDAIRCFLSHNLDEHQQLRVLSLYRMLGTILAMLMGDLHFLIREQIWHEYSLGERNENLFRTHIADDGPIFIKGIDGEWYKIQSGTRLFPDPDIAKHKSLMASNDPYTEYIDANLVYEMQLCHEGQEHVIYSEKAHTLWKSLLCSLSDEQCALFFKKRSREERLKRAGEELVKYRIQPTPCKLLLALLEKEKIEPWMDRIEGLFFPSQVQINEKIKKPEDKFKTKINKPIQRRLG